MVDLIQALFDFLDGVNFAMVFQVLGIGFLVFWVVVIGWVAVDSTKRFTSFWLRLLSVLIVMVFNIFGLFIYLIIRPSVTREDGYWMDLERRYLMFETMGLEDCPNCGFHLLPNFINCPNCGLKLRLPCRSCEVHLEPEWRVCPFCGTKRPDKEVAAHLSGAYQAGEARKRREKGARRPKDSGKKKGGLRGIAVGVDGFLRYIGTAPSRLANNMSSRKQERESLRKKKGAVQQKQQQQPQAKEQQKQAQQKSAAKQKSAEQKTS